MSREALATPATVAQGYADSLRRFGLDENYIARISRVTGYVCSATLRVRSESLRRELTTDDVALVVSEADGMLKEAGVSATTNEVYALGLMVVSGQFGDFISAQTASDAIPAPALPAVAAGVPISMINAAPQYEVYEGEK